MNNKKNFKRTLSALLAMAMVLPAVSSLGAYAATKKTAFTKVTATSTTDITLKWKKISTVNGYEIYQKKAGEKYRKIKTIKSKKTASCKISKLTAATKYSYKIRTYKTVKKKKQYSSFSAAKSVTTKPTAPILTSAVARDNNVNLQWKTVKGAKGYVIYKKTEKGNIKVKTVAAKETSVDLEGVAKEVFTARAYLTDNKKNVYSDYAKEITAQSIYVPEETVERYINDIKTLLENSYVTDQKTQEYLEEIKTLFAENYVTKEMMEESYKSIKNIVTNEYVSNESLDTYLADLKAEVKNTYATKTKLDECLSQMKSDIEKGYVTNEKLDEHLNEIKTILSSEYATKEMMEESYNSIRDILTNEYVSNESMDKYLADLKAEIENIYVTKTRLDECLSQMKSDIEKGYVTNEKLDEHLNEIKTILSSEYATKKMMEESYNSIRDILTNDYVSNANMDKYLKDLKAEFESLYVTKSKLDECLAEIKNSIENGYATNEKLDRYFNEIKGILTDGYVTQDMLDEYLNEIRESVTSSCVTEEKMIQYMDEIKKAMGNYNFVDITDTLTIENYFYAYWNGEKQELPEVQSCYISVTPGDKFRVSGYSLYDVALALFFDKDGKIIDNKDYLKPNGKKYNNHLISIPTGCYYVAFSSYIVGLPRNIMLKVKKYQLSDTSDVTIINSSLYEKRMYANGDSIAEGAELYSYVDSITDKYSMSTNNEANSGTTLAVREGRTDSICERILAMDTTEEYDYILIEGGFNDLLLSMELGEITNPRDFGGYYDRTTVIGATETICHFLVNNYYETKKLFVLGHKLFGFWDQQIEYWDAIISVLEKWGIPYVDLRRESNLCKRIGDDPVADKYFVNGDGIHPTKEAYEIFYVPLIKSKLEDL